MESIRDTLWGEEKENKRLECTMTAPDTKVNKISSVRLLVFHSVMLNIILTHFDPYRNPINSLLKKSEELLKWIYLDMNLKWFSISKMRQKRVTGSREL
jgi:hypothetical protein